jgi:hypothetical protein
MNSYNPSKPKDGWKVVGQKEGESHPSNTRKYIKPPNRALNDKHVEVKTPEDVYYANLKVTPAEVSEVPDISEYLVKTIMDQTSDMTPHESLNTLSKIVMFAVETMTNIIKDATSKISNIGDDQKKVIALIDYLENISESRLKIGTTIGKYDKNVGIMNTLKKTSIENIKKFLTTCGIDEIPAYRREKEEKIYDPSHGRSYASSIGATSSDLIVEKQPVVINNNVEQSTFLVNMGIVDVNMPVVLKMKEVRGFTLSYSKQCKVFVIRMGDTVFTAGPGDFVDLKNSNRKTKHAKRCLNPIPCQYKHCKYYHDPCTTGKGFNTDRNFAISYVLDMLRNVQDNDALLGNKFVRDPNFLRDLVQLGCILLGKAAQIQALYFKGKKI